MCSRKMRGNPINEQIFDNKRVVPHNLWLLMKYRCHLNVEVCNSITAVKYLYKYVYKGHDRVMYGVKSKDQLDLPADRVQGPARDEIREFVEARYVTTSEACWRTFEFPMGKLYPEVQRLNIHLENEQHILCDSSKDIEEIREVLKESEVTHLTQFFMLCLEEKLMCTQNHIPWSRPSWKTDYPNGVHKDDGGPPARDILCRDVSKWYKWVQKNAETGENAHWKRRSRGTRNTVGRVRHVPPSTECKELFHFRLLLNTITGPTSFKDLRTVVLDNGETKMCDTCQEAALLMGLIQDDKEYFATLEESSIVASASQIRSLFVIILTHGMPQNALLLWKEYKDVMSDDFKNQRVDRHGSSTDRAFTDEDYNHALLDIESQLESFPKSKTTDYGLPATREPTRHVHPDRVPSEIRDALNFDRDHEGIKARTLISKFNDEQMTTFNEVNESVKKREGKCFYVNGAGGCGKTTVAKALLHEARSRGDIAIACASSGIAATRTSSQRSNGSFSIQNTHSKFNRRFNM